MRKPALLLLLAAFGVANAAPKVEVVAEGLEYPWSIAFLPGGEMLVTERNGRLRVIENGVLRKEPVAGVPEAFVTGQGGLFDVVPDPAFADNRIIYLSLAYGTASENATRVVRARYDGEALSEQTVLFTATPWKKGASHYGARMAFLPDGTLLVTVGEGFDYRESAQRLDTHLGKVVRIESDGSVPEDNPFVATSGALPEIYSFGHRNPQAILVSAGDGRI